MEEYHRQPEETRKDNKQIDNDTLNNGRISQAPKETGKENKQIDNNTLNNGRISQQPEETRKENKQIDNDTLNNGRISQQPEKRGNGGERGDERDVNVWFPSSSLTCYLVSQFIILNLFLNTTHYNTHTTLTYFSCVLYPVNMN